MKYHEKQNQYIPGDYAVAGGIVFGGGYLALFSNNDYGKIFGALAAIGAVLYLHLASPEEKDGIFK
jgi:hypothetical protein